MFYSNLIMAKLTILLPYFIIWTNSKFVIKSEDLKNVKPSDIEREASLVETFDRDTDCEGVKVENSLCIRLKYHV